MTESSGTDGSGRGRRSKVARLIEEYELEGLGAEMERLWTDDEDRRSLRDLATRFNQELLARTLEEAGVQQLDGEVENTYRLLTADDVGGADRTRVRRRLEREGVDLDALLDDFVTYQAVRTYLRSHREAEYTPAETDPIERETRNLQRLRGRIDTVTEGKLEQLREDDQITLGEFRTIVDVRVICEDCGGQFDVVDLLADGGCDCARE
jgi:hypothetical protein